MKFIRDLHIPYSYVLIGGNTMNTEFQAYGTAGKAYGDTPRAAAMRYFAENPKSRKCSVLEGMRDGVFFTVRYGRSSVGEWPYSAHDIAKSMAALLPDNRQKNG